jgi:hypothetical protein
MRRGKLIKTINYPKNSIDWDRHSNGSGTWAKVSAYLDAHDMKTYVGLVELDNYRGHRIKFGFTTIEEAFKWADAQVDYKNDALYPKDN